MSNYECGITANRFIPKIKSHVAEEITLDRCVQRLRQRLMMESRMQTSGRTPGLETTGEKMNKRVPSFFTSPSLVNFGGLALGDPYNLQALTGSLNPEDNSNGGTLRAEVTSPPPILPPIQFRPGWGGLGLQGNHSHASLTKVNNNSVGSGLFLEDESEDWGSNRVIDDKQYEQAAGEAPHVQQQNGQWENEEMRTSLSSLPDFEQGGYIKTTSMANFYYRKTQSHGDLIESDSSESDQP